MSIAIISACIAAAVLSSVLIGYHFGLKTGATEALAAFVDNAVSSDTQTEDAQGENVIEIPGDTGSISIPGFKKAIMEAGQEEQALSLNNPANNTCYFVISIFLPDGQEIFRSGLLAPGKSLDTIELLRTLEAGTYDNSIIRYSCYALNDMAPLNGADVNFTLEVRP